MRKKRNNRMSLFLKGAAVVLLLGSIAGCKTTRQKSMESHRLYGIQCLENGDYEGAIEAFDEALELSLGNIGETELDICYYKARAQYLNGDIQGAMDTYTSILNYKDEPSAYFLRGCLYFDLEDVTSAKNDCKKAYEIDSDNYELCIGIYKLYATHNLEEEGKDYLQKGLAIEGDKPYDKMQKGRIYFLLEEYETAIVELEEALDAGEEEANFYLAQIYRVQGEETLSEQYFQAYMNSGVASAESLYEFGKMQLEEQDYEHAVVYLEAAMDTGEVSNQQSLMRNLMIAYEYTGKFEEARELMEEYVEKYPSDKDAIREYEFLVNR